MLVACFRTDNQADTSEESKHNSKEALKELGGEKAFFSKDSK